eukprot:Selendium_serpulae@DN10082_c0_g1_i1.p1
MTNGEAFFGALYNVKKDELIELWQVTSSSAAHGRLLSKMCMPPAPLEVLLSAAKSVARLHGHFTLDCSVLHHKWLRNEANKRNDVEWLWKHYAKRWEEMKKEHGLLGHPAKQHSSRWGDLPRLIDASFEKSKWNLLPRLPAPLTPGGRRACDVDVSGARVQCGYLTEGTDAIDTHGWPWTVVHGDLHVSNFLWDWEDGAVDEMDGFSSGDEDDLDKKQKARGGRGRSHHRRTVLVDWDMVGVD